MRTRSWLLRFCPFVGASMGGAPFDSGPFRDRVFCGGLPTLARHSVSPVLDGKKVATFGPSLSIWPAARKWAKVSHQGMASFMPPWLDWLEWLKWDSIGAGVIGRILGLWFGVCVSAIRTLLRIVLGQQRGFAGYAHSHSDYRAFNQRLSVAPSPRAKLFRLTVSTLLTFVAWVTITWKPLWTAAGPRGDRVLAAILLLVNASWLISLVRICCSKSRRKGTAVAASPSVKARYIRSSSAKAS